MLAVRSWNCGYFERGVEGGDYDHWSVIVGVVSTVLYQEKYMQMLKRPWPWLPAAHASRMLALGGNIPSAVSTEL